MGLSIAHSTMKCLARPRTDRRTGNAGRGRVTGAGLTPQEYMAKFGTPAQKRAAKQRTANRYPKTASGLEIIAFA